MINICKLFCEKNNYKYIVKLHPNDRENKYSSYYESECYVKTVERDMAIYDFASMVELCIMSKSSVYMELLFLGIPVFRFHNNCEKDIFEGLNDFKFSSYEEMEELIREMYFDRKKYLSDFAQVREYCCGKGNIRANYERAINELR